VGSRYFWDDLRSGQSATLSPSNDSNLTSNAFIQDKYTLIDESLYLIVGSKFDYFGEDKSQHPIEIQPTIRLLHTRKNDEFWMAVSRAVRSDNRSQRDGTYIIDHNGDKYTVVVPNDLATETLMAYEAGVRHTFSKEAHTDLSLYVNDYDNLIMLRFDPVAKTAMLDNTLKGTAYGLEWLFDWQAADWLRLQPSTSIIYQNIYGDSGAPAGSSMPEEGLGTETKLQVLTKPYKDVGLDVSLGYLDSPDQMRLPGFFSLDVHGSWKATDSLMLEIIARNLDGGERQFSQFEVGPRLDLRLTWDF
jgi:iron complex outermembrane receptor protein